MVFRLNETVSLRQRNKSGPGVGGDGRERTRGTCEVVLRPLFLFGTIMALVRVADLKKIPDLKTQDEGYLTFLANGASATIKSYLKRDLERATYIEYYDGTDRPELVLRNYPVSSITNIWVDGDGYYGQGASAFPASTLLTAGENYVLQPDYGGTLSRTGVVLRLGGGSGTWPGFFPSDSRGKLAGKKLAGWPRGWGNIKVEYIAGYAQDDIPDDIRTAGVMIAAVLNRSLPLGGYLQSESLGGYSYSIGTGMLGNFPEIGTVRQLLSRYREPSI